MKKIWIGIKAVIIVLLGFSVFLIMVFTTLVYGICSSIKSIRKKRVVEYE